VDDRWNCSSCRSRAPDGFAWRMTRAANPAAKSSGSAMPTRTATLTARSANGDRKGRDHGRQGVDAGHQGLGPEAPGTPAELLNANPAMYFSANCPRRPGPGHRAAWGIGVPLTSERSIAVDRAVSRSARRSGWPPPGRSERSHEPAGAGPGHRQRDTRQRPRRFLLGLRRRGRADWPAQ